LRSLAATRSLFRVSSFEVHGDRTVQLRDPKGELLLTVETVPGEFGCRHAIVSIRFSARREDRFERRSTPEGRCYLVLKNHEGLVLGETPRYESNDACEQAARRLRLAASEARVVYFPKPGSDRNA
jgi:uncharacterized protein